MPQQPTKNKTLTGNTGATPVSGSRGISRRRFMQRSAIVAGGIAAPWIVPSSALGRGARPAPSNLITMASIGVGGMGSGNMHNFMNLDDCRVLAVCDVDREHAAGAKQRVDEKYGNQDCKVYHDFRDVLARDDIDAVVISTPDHWHAAIAVAAAAAGKDIYCEKPISHCYLEGRAIADAVKRYGRVWQTGSWQRSVGNFRQACELVRNDRIGKVHTIEVGLPVNGSSREYVPFTQQTPPDQLDYEFWVGPSPRVAYQEKRVHYHWRWHLNYGGGALLDWIGHHLDIAHWGMNWDHSGPIEIDAHGVYQGNGIYNAAHQFHVAMKYRGDVSLTVSGNEGMATGTKWIGSDGWVYVDRGRIDAHPKSLLKEQMGPQDTHLLHSPGHGRNFIDCIKLRKQALTPAETAHRSVAPGHLGQISMQLGRKLRFDPDTEQIIDDPTATRMLGHGMRAPWSL